MPTVFLLTGTTSFADPGTWDPTNNKVECLGAGAFGGTAFSEGNAPGGGGGGYGYANNLAATFPVATNIAAKGASGGNPTAASAFNTWWNTSNFTAGSVQGCCGSTTASNATFYPNGFNGGRNGGPNSLGSLYGSGGGGAAGPHGAGGNGVYSDGNLGNGGTADGGTVAGTTTAGQAGLSGTQWPPNGCGSGGAGGSATVAGGAGGQFGGGGGGRQSSGSPTANGAGDGLMIVFWVPLVAARAQIIVMS